MDNTDLNTDKYWLDKSVNTIFALWDNTIFRIECIQHYLGKNHS